MAHALFDGYPVMDNQSEMGAESLVEPQAENVASAVTSANSAEVTATSTVSLPSEVSTQKEASATGDSGDEDIFVCGKCKKKFTHLALFIAHKKETCTAAPCHNVLTTTHTVTSPNVGTLSVPLTLAPSSGTQELQVTFPATMLTQGMVINEADILSLTTASLGEALFSGSYIPHMTTAGGTVIVTTTQAKCSSNGTGYVMVTEQDMMEIEQQHQQQQQQQQAPQQEEDQNETADVVQQDDESAPTAKEKVRKKVRKSGRVPKRKKNAAYSDVDDDDPKARLKCGYCLKVFTKNFDLNQHLRSHTGEKPFQCIVCGRAFAQKSNVKKHMHTHKVWPDGLTRTLPTQSVIEVIDDGASGVSASSAKEPNAASKDKPLIVIDKSYVCCFCNKSFETYFKLKTHLKLHKTEQVYKCTLKQCAQTFPALDTYLEHMKSHEPVMTYKCHVCGKTFKCLMDLGTHQYSHSLYPNKGSRLNPKQHRCTICMNKYATQEALDHHLATSTHHYSCPHCQKIFPCERYLRRHLPIHGTEGQYKCTECPKTFKTESYLRIHRLVHSTEKPFTCRVCKASFNRRDKLRRHEHIHDPIKRFRCPFRNHTGCTKEFSRADKLKDHILTHSGIRPYKCKLCDRTFSRKAHLRDHVQLHTDEYPYRCPGCDKGFTRAKRLKNHINGCPISQRIAAENCERQGSPGTSSKETTEDVLTSVKGRRAVSTVIISTDNNRDPNSILELLLTDADQQTNAEKAAASKGVTDESEDHLAVMVESGSVQGVSGFILDQGAESVGEEAVSVDSGFAANVTVSTQDSLGGYHNVDVEQR